MGSYWKAAQLPALAMVAPLAALFAVIAMLRPDPGVLEGLTELALGGCMYAAMTINKFRKPSVQLAH